ncbi:MULTISPECIES: carbohydrate ABC transporter permease [Paenibacillus]|jgi:putative aldouronate transport system permease protein|uniref:Sugar ABC transporter permease n=1 Tax=Paenibacillus odorifer TaxID=189426 RepID=A0A1R0X554_9BACL|nr:MULTISPECIES: carbohydrate ABC transporter permease [Paenibacillus]AIQ73221.1 sugar ABC transporter permease [Paenibacillus odorifer]ETT61350.1 binding-protein-dependent transport systems inner membrane component [Paenibacillus sp. FSL H8-237]MEC0130266.1 carbohydrate ABC transporter permease [Paenibacillus odorifer]MEC0222177.1 carbohydrate ABC transporter permease [Paenibacillus odorifer]OMC95823.1 sugar ABC transporter permease [Paenibacillus odorifer]
MKDNLQRKTKKRRKHKSIGDRVFDGTLYTLLTALTLVCFYPILHILFASVSDPGMLIAHKGILLKPLGFTLDGYKLVFKDNSLINGYKNTIIYVGLGTLVNMIMTILGAYVLSRRGLYFKNFIMILITITMFFGGGLIPWFLLMKDIGLYNNLWAMILPSALSTWNIIILRTSFQAIPQELEEAATIDGASQAHILTNVILPLSKATLAVIFLYYLVGNWNSWFNAMVLLKDRQLFPLQLLMKEILVANDATATSIGSAGGVVIDSAQSQTAFRELVKYCAIVVSTLPILMVYPFLQKYFVKGVYVGSIKG